MKHLYFLALLTAVIVCSCVEAEHQFSKLPPGIWRATLTLEDRGGVAAVEGGGVIENRILLPFNFEVIYTSDDIFHIELINGEERIKVDQIHYGRDNAVARDTVLIEFPVFDTYISAIFMENVLEGEWVVNYRDNYRIPFVAHHGKGHRFESDGTEATYNMGGRWQSIFDKDTEDEYPAIGDFKQIGSRLTGTFLTETGDYRFLEGHVRKDKFALSCFDGSHAFLFEGKMMDKDNLLGNFYSGTHYTGRFESVRNDSYTLMSPFDLTTAVKQTEAFNFRFPNTSGKMVSLNDDEYKGKVKIVEIMGTWCPNCKDASDFLVDYTNKNPSDDLEIIALSFERYREEGKALAAIDRYKTKWAIPHEVLYCGYYDKGEASKQIPQISRILSYPTMLFLDKDNMIRKIHTGFSGPATDEFQTFKTSFKETVDLLLAEI